jgi:hypothetical protein
MAKKSGSITPPSKKSGVGDKPGSGGKSPRPDFTEKKFDLPSHPPGAPEIGPDVERGG